MPRRFAPRSGPSSRAITSTGCWRRMPTAALLRLGANGSPHAPQSGRLRNSILCPENPGRYTLIHEFLSIMLGVQRPGVTVALQMLEAGGMIRTKRGQITITDRGRLEALAGGSYGVPEA